MKIHIKSLSRSTTGTIALITLVTVWSELSKPFKTFLADITGHHWVTKGLFSLAFFLFLYYIFSRLYKVSTDVKMETYYVIGAIILGGATIFIFYLWHFFI